MIVPIIEYVADPWHMPGQQMLYAGVAYIECSSYAVNGTKVLVAYRNARPELQNYILDRLASPPEIGMGLEQFHGRGTPLLIRTGHRGSMLSNRVLMFKIVLLGNDDPSQTRYAKFFEDGRYNIDVNPNWSH